MFKKIFYTIPSRYSNEKTCECFFLLLGFVHVVSSAFSAQFLLSTLKTLVLLLFLTFHASSSRRRYWALQDESNTLYITCSCAYVQSLQLCPTLNDSMECRLLCPWNSQGKNARVAMPSFPGSSRLRDQTRVSYVSCIGRQVLYH